MNNRRQIYLFFLLLALGAFALPSQAQISCSVAQGTACEPYVVPMYAGRTTDVGTVTVRNDETNLYVTYTIDTGRYPDARLYGTLHVWVGTDVGQVPFTPTGNPKIGRFPYKSPDLTGANLKEYEFKIPLSGLALTLPPNGGSVKDLANTTLFVLAHGGVVGHKSDALPDTTWAGCTAVNLDDPGRWYYQLTYRLRFCEAPPPVPMACETAFGRLALNSSKDNVWVFTTDTKSNPEKLKSLALTKNRWGWANRLDPNSGGYGPLSGTLYAGAGLNNVSKAKAVGSMTVNVASGKATVDFIMNGGNTLEEVHVYASGSRPTTLAPGQYGYVAQPENPSGHIAVIDVTPGLNGEVWIIAHGVACYPKPL